MTHEERAAEMWKEIEKRVTGYFCTTESTLKRLLAKAFRDVARAERERLKARVGESKS